MKSVRLVMLFTSKLLLEMLRELEDVMLMLVSTISKLRSMFPCPKEMFIRKKKLFKMSHSMILIWLMPDLKEEMTL